MKNLIRVVAITVLTITAVASLQSFTTVNQAQTELSKDGPVQFKFINDTDKEIKFCVNGSQSFIKVGESMGMTYVAGTKVKHSNGTACGSDWFTITQDFHGKSIKISELKK
ncbi:MAG TPA: hypothetical protein PLI97_00335 [Fluviicola sp.]|nr:hypothetical protein [Fluviicola sp.]